MPSLETARRLFRRRESRDFKAAVGGHWDDVGRMQFDFLVKHVRPSERLLDVPCGSFRAGRFLIDYLDVGNYIGVDGDAQLIKLGRRHVLGKELMAREPVLIHRRMPAELPEADVAWVHALFDHIPPDDVRATIGHLSRAVPRFFATFFLTDTPEQPKKWLRYGSEEGAIWTQADEEYWHHSPDFVREAAENAGAEIVRFHDDYAHPLGLTLVEFRRVA